MAERDPAATCAVYAFDAYGTLFDVHAAVRRHAAAIGAEWERFSALWRTKQLEYTWVRSLSGRYRDFWSLTEDALDFALASFPSVERGIRSPLLDAYRELDCYPEVAETLRTLRAAGKRLAILSNGTPEMLASAVRAAGLADAFDAILSVDAVRIYKTDPRAYDLVTGSIGVEAGEVSFQSSNRWDIAGAAAYGMRAVWINRNGAPDEYPDLAPTATLRSLEGLPGI